MIEPRVAAFHVIDLQSEPDRHLRVERAGFFDRFDVPGEVMARHSPVVEIVCKHRVVVGTPEFRQADGGGGSSVIGRPSLGVAAQRGVCVVIGKHDPSIINGMRGAAKFFSETWNFSCLPAPVWSRMLFA